MSLWLWIALNTQSALVCPIAHAAVPPQGAPSSTSNGPTSPEEASILWSEGRKAFEAGRFEEAIPPLQRLVDRYPAQEGYTDAHLYLGVALTRTGKAAQAIDPLRYYVEAKGKTLDGIKGRLELGAAYVEANRADEAYLTALEVLKAKGVPADFSIRGLLLKAEALLEQGHDLRAWQSVDSGRKQIAQNQSEIHRSDLLGHAQYLGLRIKARDCARLPSRGPLDEAQTRAQLARRGTCELEGLIKFKDTAETGDPTWSKRAADELIRSLEEYDQACSRPPVPKGKRTAAELDRYRAELVAVITRDCRAKYSKGEEMIASWRKAWNQPGKDPLPSDSLVQINRVSQTFRKLAH
jgi:tetratricopeptide (TPR) repeat protein